MEFVVEVYNCDGKDPDDVLNDLTNALSEAGIPAYIYLKGGGE